MDLMFLGCGAADYDWSNYGQEGILGSTVSLLNGHILLDCGPTAAASMWTAPRFIRITGASFSIDGRSDLSSSRADFFTT